jgi:hypothetical protein
MSLDDKQAIQAEEAEGQHRLSPKSGIHKRTDGGDKGKVVVGCSEGAGRQNSSVIGNGETVPRWQKFFVYLTNPAKMSRLDSV